MVFFNDCESSLINDHLECEICPCRCHIDQRATVATTVDPETGEVHAWSDEHTAFRHHAGMWWKKVMGPLLLTACDTCGLQPEEGEVIDMLCCAALSNTVRAL